MKKFSIHNNTFLSGSIISMLEQAFSSVTSFLTGIVIAHNCTMETAGLYALVLSVSMLGLGLQRVIIAVPFNVHYPKFQQEEKRRNYRSAIMGLEFYSLLLAGIIAWIIGYTVYPQVGGLPCAVFLVGYLLKDYARQFFLGMIRVTQCLLMSLMQCFVQIGILFVWREHLTLEFILFGIGMSCIICTIIYLLPYLNISFNLNKLREAWNINWWTAKWSIGISMSDSLKNQLSVWLLKLFQSTEAVAIYNNNNTLATLPQPVFMGLSQFLLPNFSKSIQEETGKKIGVKIVLISSFAVSANLIWSIVLFLLGKSLVSIFYGTDYYAGIAPLLMCCLRGIFVSLTSIENSVLQAFQKPQIIFKILLLSIAFLSTIGAFWIYKSGVMGVCTAMMVVYMIPAVCGAAKIYMLVRGKQK